jgi:hypothetical protein
MVYLDIRRPRCRGRVGEPATHRHRDGRCLVRRSFGGLQSAACRPLPRPVEPFWAAGGPWNSGHGHGDRLDQPGAPNRHDGAAGDSRMEIPPTNLLWRYDSRLFEGRGLAASRQRPARRGHVATTRHEPGRARRAGRPHSNPRASTNPRVLSWSRYRADSSSTISKSCI